MEESEFSEHERLHIQQIRELDLEELQVEIIGDDSDVSSNEHDGYSVLRVHGDGGLEQYQEFTLDTSLAPLHSYLGETDDTHGRMAYFDGGVTLTIAMLYLEGVVLFPEAILPLRVIRSEFKASVQRALNQIEAPFIIGVVGTTRPTLGSIPFGTIGTTAEIRQYKRLDDGALNVVARGQQRFYLQRQWIDVEGAECAEVQIIQEDTPLRTPRVAFAQLASSNNLRSLGVSSSALPNVSCSNHIQDNVENEWECLSKASTQSDQSPRDPSTFKSPHDSPIGMFDGSSVSDDEFMFEWKEILGKSFPEKLDACHHAHYRMNECESTTRDSSKQCTSTRKSEIKASKNRKLLHMPKHAYKAPLSFWPHWVYEIYDSYSLAQRVADMWKQISGAPKIHDLVKNPDILSFYIASRLPLSQTTRQELLEIHGVSYRLQRELQLLKRFNIVRCKSCQTVIAKRSDMLVMSSDGPLNAYVNEYGYVSETMTFYNASHMVLNGRPVEEHSWFPGYAWTIANCEVCESHMGWLFTTSKKNLKPKHFWAIRSSQIADDTSS